MNEDVRNVADVIGEGVNEGVRNVTDVIGEVVNECVRGVTDAVGEVVTEDGEALCRGRKIYDLTGGTLRQGMVGYMEGLYIGQAMLRCWTTEKDGNHLLKIIRGFFL